jgi:hypothetical protein
VFIVDHRQLLMHFFWWNTFPQQRDMKDWMKLRPVRQLETVGTIPNLLLHLEWPEVAESKLGVGSHGQGRLDVRLET